jgi:DNA-binding CsgD family transcriptional regulator
MGETASKRSPFGQVSLGAANLLREAIARARWIALDLDTTRFAVMSVSSSQDRGRLTLCFDNEHPQMSAVSRALLGPMARPLLAHSMRATIPCVWSAEPDCLSAPSLLHGIDAPVPGVAGIAFPVTTSSGQPGLVVFVGHRMELSEQQIFDIHARCFHLFETAALLAGANPSAMCVASRERDCLDLSSHGLTSDEIAEELGLSPHTVNQYLTNTARKLGAVNRVHVVAKALRLGLIS